MKMLKVQVNIPDTEGAKAALTEQVWKILKAHKAEGHELFQIIEEKPQAAKKAVKKSSSKSKPAAKSDDSDSNTQQSTDEQPADNTETA